MKAFVVLAHPEEKSFNGALYRTAEELFSQGGHEFKGSDLYRMAFNPVSGRDNFKTVKDPDYFKQQMEENLATAAGSFADDIEAEMQKLEWCDLLILQFPLWWFSLPAIMKGWVDRVFASGRVYGSGRYYEKGAFAGKKAMLSLTTGGGETAYGADGLHGDLQSILYPINHGILSFVGFQVLTPFISFSPAHVDQEERSAELMRYQNTLRLIDERTPIVYPSLNLFDERGQLKRPVKA